MAPLAARCLACRNQSDISGIVTYLLECMYYDEERTVIGPAKCNPSVLVFKTMLVIVDGNCLRILQ